MFYHKYLNIDLSKRHEWGVTSKFHSKGDGRGYLAVRNHFDNGNFDDVAIKVITCLWINQSFDKNYFSKIMFFNSYTVLEIRELEVLNNVNESDVYMNVMGIDKKILDRDFFACHKFVEQELCKFAFKNGIIDYHSDFYLDNWGYLPEYGMAVPFDMIHPYQRNFDWDNGLTKVLSLIFEYDIPFEILTDEYDFMSHLK